MVGEGCPLASWVDMWFHCELYLHVHTQLISLLIFINWHGVCLRRKGKTPCFNSCLIRKDRDKSSGSQHFHEVSRTFPGLSHSQGQDSYKESGHHLRNVLNVVNNLGLKSNKYWEGRNEERGREEL